MRTIPSSARSHLTTQRRESQEALSAIKRQWRRMGPDFDASWALIVGSIVGITSTAQRRIAEDSIEYIPTVLDEMGYQQRIDRTATANPEAFVGVTGAGVSVGSAFHAAVVRSKIAIDRGYTIPQALHAGEDLLMRRASLALSDTGRLSERVALAPAKISYYERALSLPSCSRCVILAGRLYRMEQAFERHPRCDCRHLPVGEKAEHEEIDPMALFESMTEAEQDRTFTKAGAEAIRNGADMSQVVNAHRGMYTSRIGGGGRKWKFTREGTSRRGYYGSQFRNPRYMAQEKVRRRLMPEEIQRIADGKADYLRMLRLYGYII